MGCWYWLILYTMDIKVINKIGHTIPEIDIVFVRCTSKTCKDFVCVKKILYYKYIKYYITIH